MDSSYISKSLCDGDSRSPANSRVDGWLVFYSRRPHLETVRRNERCLECLFCFCPSIRDQPAKVGSSVNHKNLVDALGVFLHFEQIVLPIRVTGAYGRGINQCSRYRHYQCIGRHRAYDCGYSTREKTDGEAGRKIPLFGAATRFDSGNRNKFFFYLQTTRDQQCRLRFRLILTNGKGPFPQNWDWALLTSRCGGGSPERNR